MFALPDVRHGTALFSLDASAFPVVPTGVATLASILVLARRVNGPPHSCWLRFASDAVSSRTFEPSPEVDDEAAIEERLAAKLPGFRVSATLRRRDGRRGGFEGLVLLSPEGSASPAHADVPYARELLRLALDDVLAGRVDGPLRVTVEVGCSDVPLAARLLSGANATALLTLAAGVCAFAASVLALFALLRWSGAVP